MIFAVPDHPGDLHQPADRRSATPAPWRRSASCSAYFLITIAAPVYLKKIGELRPGHVVHGSGRLASACWCRPIGSFYPVPPYPVRIFPYIFVAWMLLGVGVALRGQPPAAGDPLGHRGRPRTGS